MTPTFELTKNESAALEALRGHIEERLARGWASVYLDNAKPADWSGGTWARALGSLAKKGLYRRDDGEAWGAVLMPADSAGA